MREKVLYGHVQIIIHRDMFAENAHTFNTGPCMVGEKIFKWLEHCLLRLYSRHGGVKKDPKSPNTACTKSQTIP